MDNLLGMLGLISACENDTIYKQARALDEKVHTLEKLAGISIDALIIMFSRGYVLVPGTTNIPLEQMGD